MLQRWLGSVLLYCEGQFKKVEGYKEIAQAVANIEALEQAEQQSAAMKKAAISNDRLLEQLLRRRKRVPELIEQVRGKRSTAFANWR